jgi:hypothetical protein
LGNVPTGATALAPGIPTAAIRAISLSEAKLESSAEQFEQTGKKKQNN